jgi:hypothetical protein
MNAIFWDVSEVQISLSIPSRPFREVEIGMQPLYFANRTNAGNVFGIGAVSE